MTSVSALVEVGLGRGARAVPGGAEGAAGVLDLGEGGLVFDDALGVRRHVEPLLDVGELLLQIARGLAQGLVGVVDLPRSGRRVALPLLAPGVELGEHQS